MKEDLEKEIARIKNRLAWLTKMYVRQYENEGKRKFLFERMKAYVTRLEGFEKKLARISE